MKQHITLISDTHGKHDLITQDLIGGDFILHSGDISSMGYLHEIESFCEWFSSLHSYTHKIFIAGNHDWGFQIKPEQVKILLDKYPNIIYLEDSFVEIEGIIIYGSPHQPEFFQWAFNLPRNGKELEEVWSKIPENTDILLTHSPAYGISSLDTIYWKLHEHLGCEKLTERILKVKPKIHSWGHIHSGYGNYSNDFTHFFNASVLNEKYQYKQKPIDIIWDTNTNEYEGHYRRRERI